MREKVVAVERGRERKRVSDKAQVGERFRKCHGYLENWPTQARPGQARPTQSRPAEARLGRHSARWTARQA